MYIYIYIYIYVYVYTYQINLDLTPLHWMHSQFPGDGSYDHEQKLRAQLANCGSDLT